jgi:hypothetical protein
MLHAQHAILIANNYDLHRKDSILGRDSMSQGTSLSFRWDKLPLALFSQLDSEDEGIMFHEMLVNFYQTAWSDIHKIVHYNLLSNFSSPLFISHTCRYRWNRLVYHCNTSPAKTEGTIKNIAQDGQLYRSQPLPSVLYNCSSMWAQKMFQILCSHSKTTSFWDMTLCIGGGCW